MNAFKPISGIFIIVVLFLSQESKAQLRFCNGILGDPVYVETFGSGIENGPALPQSVISYPFEDGAPAYGSYTISSSTDYFNWFAIDDHTPNDDHGKSLIVNVGSVAGEFYRQTIPGLEGNTTYELSAWLINLLPLSSASPSGGLPVNINFQIWDGLGNEILASGNTEIIRASALPIWRNYGLPFRTLPGQTSIILKILTNGSGGANGNDFAIDDIVFRPCENLMEIMDSQDNTNILICENEAPIMTDLTLNLDFSTYDTPEFQWQQSIDGVNWANIFGENGQTYTTPQIAFSTYYRVQIAEDSIDLSNPLNNSLSEVFEIIVVPDLVAPSTTNTVITLCSGQNDFISVSVPDYVNVNWYDAPTGGNLLLENGLSYLPNTEGIYYAEAVSRSGSCSSAMRTGITVGFSDPPMVTDEELEFCEGDQQILSTGVDNMSYLWSTGEITPTIGVNEPGDYSVIVTNQYGCQNTKTIFLKQLEFPIIEKIVSSDLDLQVIMSNSGVFEYSLDGIIYQRNNTFPITEGGLYNVHVRNLNARCGEVVKEHIHLVIPKFFTPNGDNVNDAFVPGGIDSFAYYEVSIYDRFGRLLKNTKNIPFSWDGTWNNKALPSSDYWYAIKIDNTLIKGHFALKR